MKALISFLTVLLFLTACAAPRPANAPSGSPGSGLSSIGITTFSPDGKPSTRYDMTASGVTASGTDQNGRAYRVSGSNMTEVQRKLERVPR